MFSAYSSPDFPLTLVSRVSEISQASDIAAANEHVRRYFEAVLKRGYGLRINDQEVFGGSLEK